MERLLPGIGLGQGREVFVTLSMGRVAGGKKEGFGGWLGDGARKVLNFMHFAHPHRKIGFPQGNGVEGAVWLAGGKWRTGSMVMKLNDMHDQ